MRWIIARVLLIVILVGSVFIVTSDEKQDGVLMSSAQMEFACQHVHGPSWSATLKRASQGGFGWRCYQTSNPETRFLDVDIERWCRYRYKLHARGGSTAYNWRCDV